MGWLPPKRDLRKGDRHKPRKDDRYKLYKSRSLQFDVPPPVDMSKWPFPTSSGKDITRVGCIGCPRLRKPRRMPVSVTECNAFRVCHDSPVGPDVEPKIN